jgi:hypothetical protein
MCCRWKQLPAQCVLATRKLFEDALGHGYMQHHSASTRWTQLHTVLHATPAFVISVGIQVVWKVAKTVTERSGHPTHLLFDCVALELGCECLLQGLHQLVQLRQHHLAATCRHKYCKACVWWWWCVCGGGASGIRRLSNKRPAPIVLSQSTARRFCGGDARSFQQA